VPETNEVFIDYEKYLKRYVLVDWLSGFKMLIVSQMGLPPPGKLYYTNAPRRPLTNRPVEKVHRLDQRQIRSDVRRRCCFGGLYADRAHLYLY
jgi:hypothetical protein